MVLLLQKLMVKLARKLRLEGHEYRRYTIFYSCPTVLGVHCLAYSQLELSKMFKPYPICSSVWLWLVPRPCVALGGIPTLYHCVASLTVKAVATRDQVLARVPVVTLHVCLSLGFLT